MIDNFPAPRCSVKSKSSGCPMPVFYTTDEGGSLCRECLRVAMMGAYGQSNRVNLCLEIKRRLSVIQDLNSEEKDALIQCFVNGLTQGATVIEEFYAMQERFLTDAYIHEQHTLENNGASLGHLQSAVAKIMPMIDPWNSKVKTVDDMLEIVSKFYRENNISGVS